MKRFEILPHTADVRIYAEATSIRELFEVSLEAICSILYHSDLTNTEFNVSEKIEVHSYDQTSLLIDFLSDALALMHKHKAIFSNVIFEKLQETELNATILGFHIDKFDKDIKAVTYHEADIKKIDNNYSTIIVIDI